MVVGSIIRNFGWYLMNKAFPGILAKLGHLLVVHNQFLHFGTLLEVVATGTHSSYCFSDK